MANIPMQNKLEQGRAAFAFLCAQKVGKNDEYESYAKKMPMMIQGSGLGASLAFIYSKRFNKQGAKTAYGILYENIEDWLKQPHNKYLINLSQNTLVEEVINLDSPLYQAVTIEVLAFLAWLRRFAEGN